MGAKDSGNVGSVVTMTDAELMWRAVNGWTDVAFGGISLALALRYEMMQVAWAQWQKEPKDGESCGQ